ncbi:MAG: carbon-nitrogen hydrolase family protein [Candidatus Helarchaeota archaeon]|nr:carbon-nitrogen hydrolase family protein [Candidatus Helarchaeota archaeon]
MKEFTLGLVQMQIINCMTMADKERNLKKAFEMIESAYKLDADLVCLPEFFSVGSWLSVGKPAQLVEPFEGPTNQQLLKLSEEFGILIVPGSSPTLKEEKIYNMGAFITPKEIAGTYVRAYDRPEYYSLGSEFPIFKTKLGKIGVIICGDIFVPEIARNFSDHGVELILNPTMNAVMYYDRFMAAARSRAYENFVFVAQVDPIGNHPAWGEMIGGSTVFNPEGLIVQKAAVKEETVLITKIHPKLKIMKIDWNAGRDFYHVALQSVISRMNFVEIDCKS